ncbi:MAG: hypothetical protein JWO52_270 [Gammaproteobacteria bacterium]|jgi:hypothetical protein|nr:hypothetical protein [Gammaproteobacteria bacterium]
MESKPADESVAICLRRDYDVELLQRDLRSLCDIERLPQPGPYHKGEWTGIALHSMGGRQSTFPSAAGVERYQECAELQRAPYYKKILDELLCPKEVVRILFLPPGGHIKEHFDFHTSFQFGLLRLHIPIVTHPDVIFVIGGQRVSWNPGELWFGDFSKIHSVRNDSPIVRAHMVIDVQINEFVLSMFPESYLERRRAAGISIAREPITTPDAELRRFVCDFRIPGEVMPMFVIGKRLASLAKGANAAVRLIDGQLTVLIDGAPAFHLERIADELFGISGLPRGMTLRFDCREHVVRDVALQMKGLPKDLYSARLGVFRGPAVHEQTFSMPASGDPPTAPGSLV